MRDILSDVDGMIDQGESVALATVVNTWGSAPRSVGAKMAITISGEIAGSVSGGCVEGAVIEEGIQAIQTGKSKLLQYGVVDEDAWNVGLACGGTIEVFVQPLNAEIYAHLRDALNRDVPVAKVTVIAGAEGVLGSELLVFEDGAHLGSLEGPAAEDGLKAGMEVLVSGVSGRAHAVTASGIVDLLVEGYPPSPELVIVGGVHISLALVKLARIMGFRTVVIDPRRAFGSTNRFPDVDRLIQAWPSDAFQEVNLTPSTAVVMLTHDPKIDDPAFVAALSSPAFFIGALGSQKTHARRRSRLEAAGIHVEQIARIYGPVGLDIGGQNPEEIALAIMAQIIAARNQRLRDSNRSEESGS